MSITSITGYKDRLALNEKKHRTALALIDVERTATSDVQRILSYRPFPINRIISPETAKFKEANLDLSTLTSFNRGTFLDDIFRSFALGPVESLLVCGLAVLEQDENKIGTTFNVSCAGVIEGYIKRYPEDVMGEFCIDKVKAYSSCLKEIEKKISDLISVKKDEITQDWTTVFKSIPNWRAWSAAGKVVCTPSQETKDLALFSLSCVIEDARNAIKALEPVVGRTLHKGTSYALDQRDAWIALFNAEMFDPIRKYHNPRLSKNL